MPTQADIEAAAHRLNGRTRRTPVLRLRDGDIPGFGPVALKLEFLQHTGSFKARGAMNRLLLAEIPAAGVVAASGGNHGAAVAYAARELGVPASIFVPEPTPEAKLRRIASYGARVVRGGAAYAEALVACRACAAETGALDVHAFDDADVLAGQGTVGREFDADAPDLTHVLVAVGGGGLIGGIAAWYAGRGVSVVSVEPERCPSLHAALEAGRPVPVAVGGLAADSLGARQVGDRMFAVARGAVTPVLVSDASIADAQAWLWERLRIVAEPGGAAAMAGLLSGAFKPPDGAVVGIVLCGANTAPGSVSRETL